ncbi:MAG: hypothetical protein HOH77_17130 [Candidatus Latescibacteria bacterium]|nr:hypothetical protein [Candidatus Latescibacterota bacterium]
MADPLVISEEDKDTGSNKSGITVRAVGIGLLIVLVIGVWATYVELYARSSRLTMGHFPLALFALMLVVLGANSLAPKIKIVPLSPEELLVIVSMGLVGAVMPVDGIAGYLLGIISSFYYFATPENQWADYFHPYLPEWLVPRGDPAIWKQFFEGTGLERGIPWEMWAVPLFWWAVFIGALLWVSACMMVMVRKQWVDHERLVFPLAAVALEMVGGTRGETGFGSLARSRLFWGGFGIAMLLFGIEILGWFNPMLPIGSYYPKFSNFYFMKDARALVINPFHFFTMGFAYMAHVDVQFSVWFFYLLNVFEGGIFARLGFDVRGAGSDKFCTFPVAVAWQGFGAMLFIVLWGFWTAREHLGNVLRKALGRAPNVDDSGELISYRVAFFGAVGGLIFMSVWLWWSGMSPMAVGLFLFGSFVLYLSTARIVAEGGIPYTWGPLSPQSFVVNLMGTEAITGGTVTSLLLSYSLVNYLRGIFMPAMVHVVRFGDLLGHHRRRLLGAVCAAAVVGLAGSFYYTLDLAYSNGAYNTYGFPPFFGGNPKGIFSSTLSMVRNPVKFDFTKIMFLGIGTGVMGLLTLLRSRVLWWGLHPIGFATSAMINTNFLALPFFISWVVKSLMLKLGGVLLYRKSLPLFLGMMVGYVVGISLCSAVDIVFFPQEGHRVHTW